MEPYTLGSVNFPGIVSARSTGWAVSTDGGASFSDNGAIPPTTPANTTQGDAGDPVMARDTGNGTIYLLTNPSRESSTWGGFRLWKSTDNGQSFTLINTAVPSVVTTADKPMIAVNNFSGLSTSGNLYAVGTASLNGTRGVTVARSANAGVTWIDVAGFEANSHGADLCIGPDGTVYVFYIVNTLVNSTNQVSLKYSWRRIVDGGWNGPLTISAHPDSTLLYSVNGGASGNPKRSNSAAADDYFVSNAFPRVAVNPINGRIYLVYADLPFPGSSTDRGDIFINEGVPQGDGSLNWTAVRKVNNDGTATDQWNPSVAIIPTGTQLFVGYYSRQGDPSNNALIKAYGAKSNLTNGFATATFDVFPISATAFPPLFPGTSTPPQNIWMYDHIWLQGGVCLDSNAMVVNPCPPNPFWTSGFEYQHFMADDYTWVTTDGSYFYFAWCDRSDTFYSGSNSRPDPNIRLGKIRQ